MISGIEYISPEFIAMKKAELGLDKPLYMQLLIYLMNVIQGNMGYSYTYKQPVIDVILPRVQNTLLITVGSFIISVILGLVLGIMASKKPYSKIDNVISTLSLITWSTPSFWMALIFLLVFGLYLGWFPLHGMYTIGKTGIEAWIDLIWHMFLPSAVLALGSFALYTRLTRASMLEEIRKDYIITARGKGCSENTVYYKHAFRNALIPIVTVIGYRMPHFFTGSIMVETIFSWPGIGTLTYNSITSRDYTMVMGIFIIVSIITILANLMSDILYTYLDPRIKYD
jgi:peptide/nickel transport system permease protein